MTAVPFSEIRSWMFDHALPFWGTNGEDSACGGFLEEVTFDGGPTSVAFKRVRVVCRQIYVFSHAALLGWEKGNALSTRGYNYLISRAWLGKDRGWARLLARDGSVLDDTPDLYDIAFVLFALAWRYKLTGERNVAESAADTLQLVQGHMREASTGGFWHELPPKLPRLQNPHMHLLEACLVAMEAGFDERFRQQADELVGLFRTRFFADGTLLEYFTEDWRRLPGERGRSVEPGHQFEWAWILAQYQRLTGTRVAREAEALVHFSERHGVNKATQATFDEVRDDGAPIRKTSRTWPNTERIKGHLGLFECSGSDPRGAVAGSARLLLDRYLNVTPRGAWIDQYDEAGKPLSSVVPASTFYHIFLAFAEILRLEERMSRLA
jgi:N-acylglucosamine 2-epimerase/mannose-6-phosphate isomerase